MRLRRLSALFLAAALAATSTGAAAEKPAKVAKTGSAAAASPLTADVDAALKRISADSLRGHLSFLSSDLLEGRGTPSRGLDLAAEYIAAQFRRAGLEAVGDDGYFQTANWQFAEHKMDEFALTLGNGKDSVRVAPKHVSFNLGQGMDVAQTGFVKLDFKTEQPLDGHGAATVGGKVVVIDGLPNLKALSQEEALAARKRQRALIAMLAGFKPALILALDRHNGEGDAGGNGRLIDPAIRGAQAQAEVPMLTVHAADAIALLGGADAAGTAGTSVALHLAAPAERAVKLRNVVGVLRGSDPVLKDTYVMVTAHYDHLGMRDGVIYNGANDDGSGTVSVVEIAEALAGLKQRPKRSIVFMTVFGEERGLLGSRYYGRNPIFPIAQTVANVNLEQIGRTDSSEGPQLNNASMTGIDFSDVGATFQRAGKLTGINVYKHAVNSDRYFSQSDNQALADQGVPAHTLCVAFAFPDYHGADDHWQKIDYANMAKVSRMVALGIVMIAQNPVAPKWDASNAHTKPYIEAWRKQHGAAAN